MAGVIALMILFPPFKAVRVKGEYNVGYGFILSDRTDKGIVNTPTLFAQIVGIAIVGGVLLVAMKRNREDKKKKPVREQRVSLKRALVNITVLFVFAVGWLTLQAGGDGKSPPIAQQKSPAIVVDQAGHKIDLEKAFEGVE